MGGLTKFMDHPTELHIQVVKRVLRYLKLTFDFGIFYRKEGDEKVVTYTNSGYARDLNEKISTLGYVFMLSSRAISWSLKKQAIVILSTTKAKFIATTSWVFQAF